MRTILRKLFGASTGNGACLSFFVFALTGLIAGIPLAAEEPTPEPEPSGTPTRLLHAFHFDGTDAAGNLMPLDSGTGGRAVPVASGVAYNSGATLTYSAGNGRDGGAYYVNKAANSFGLFNRDGLGCGSDTGFTISFWMKRNSFETLSTSRGANRSIMSFGIGEASYWIGAWVNPGAQDNQITLFPNNPERWENNNPNVTIPDNEWHHYAFVFRADANGEGQAGMALYLDGVQQAVWTRPWFDVAYNDDEPGTVPAFEGQLSAITFGSGTGSRSALKASELVVPTSHYTSYQDTYLDEFGLFDRSLTDEEIAELATQTRVALPSTCSNPDNGLWVASAPDVLLSGNNQSTAASVHLRFSSLLNAAGKTMGETETLRGISVEWGDGGNAANTSITHVILVKDGTVAAVSEAAQPTGLQGRVASFFPFPEGTTVETAADHTLYFLGDIVPAVGDSFGNQTGITANLTIYTSGKGDTTGCYVTGHAGYAPAMSFLLGEAAPEQPLGALNINFDTDASRLDAETLYGLDGVQYPGSQWNTLTTAPGRNTVSGQSVTDTEGHTLTVSYYGNSFEDYGDSYAPLLHTILMDGGGGAGLNPNVQIETIPYETYDVYIYMNSNSPGEGNASVRVNDEAYYYIMEAGQDSATQVEAAARWAQNGDMTQVALGTTVMRIANLSGRTLKVEAMHTAGGRGNIAAVQVVELRTEPDPTHWEGTISENAAASTLMVSNGTTQKALSELTEADTVELAFTGTVSLNVDTAVTVDALTLVGTEGVTLITVANGGSLTAAETAIEGGTVMTAEGTFDSESPIDLAEGATLQVQGADGASFTQAVTGAGAVEIYTGSDITVEADFTHTGGTTVNGVVEGDTQTTTTLRYAGHAVGSVTVGPGGVFDLNGHACAQFITLNGGTLRADEAINDTVGGEYVASIDFNNNANESTPIPADTIAGVLGMRGEYWTAGNGTSGNGTLAFYASDTIAGAGATRAAESTISWNSGAVWGAGSNWQYLHGYLDDRQTNPGTVTLSIPEVYATHGYTLYLYSNTDDGAVFSAREIIGDDGVTTAYTYVNGALTTGNTTGWGNINAGRTTVAEGINLMVIPDLHHRNPVIRLWDRTLNSVRTRGCLPALQIRAGTPEVGNFAGALNVTGAGSQIEIADGLDISFVGVIIVSGEGTLSKSGTGTLTFGGTVTGNLTVDAGALALNEATISGTVTVNNENGLTLDAASYEGLTVNLPEAATAQATAESVTIGALTGEGSFDFNGATRLTLANATDAFTGTYANATAATLAVSGGTLAVTDAQIAQVGVLRAEGGTLTLPNAEVKDLEVAGGAVTGPGGASLAAYTEISAGSVALTAAGTAASARPAMVGADDASVENFSLVECGTIYYNTPDDRTLYFPEGFIPFRGADAQPYVIVLGEDFADFATFPFSFTVLGADTDASFTLQRPDGTAAPEASYTADGSAITVWNVGAIIDYSEELPEAKYRYLFNNDETSNGAVINQGSVGTDADLIYNANSAPTYTEENVDNGAAMVRGNPWVRTWNLVFGASDEANAWTAGFYLTLGENPTSNVILWSTAANGGNSTAEGSFFLATGAESGTLTLWRRVGDSKEEVATADLNAALGGAAVWHHFMIVHSPSRIRLYVDGEQVAERDGSFTANQRGFQMGSHCGNGPTNIGLSSWTSDIGVKIDELTIWPAALRDVQIEKALATTTAAWRIREGETPAELFTANAPWTRTDGSSDVFAAADEDASTLTARATLSVKAGVDELFTALQSFTARYVLLEGEPLTYALTGLTAPTLPANIQTLVVDNDLTIDLSAVNLAMASQIAAEPEGYCILPSRWRGALTLTHIPDGFEFDIEARDDGVYLTFVAGGAGSVRALNINFDSDASRLEAETAYGLEGVQYPGSQWNTLTTDSNGSVASGLSVTDTVGNSLTVSYFGKGFETFANSEYNPLLKTVLMDGGGGNAVDPYVQIEGIPYAAYDAYIYMASNYNDGVDYFHNAAVQVNDGDYYTMLADQDAATVVDAPGQGVWAVGQDPRQVALGVTVMRIAGLSDETLKLTTTHRSGGGRGNIAAVQVVAVAPLYTRTVNGTEAWEATGAWTKVPDGTTVDVPPEGARLMVETTDASILTVDGALPAYDSLTVVGGGTLALSVDGQSLLSDDQYKAIPRGQAHTVTILDATIDPAQVSAWVSALKYGATATVSATEAGISVDVRLPDAAYPEAQPDDSESISFNFWDFTRNANAGRLAADATGASGTAYAALGAYWAQPAATVSDQGITQTVDAIVVANADRANVGATTQTLTDAITFGLYHTYRLGIGSANQPILTGYANGHSLTGGQGSGGIPYATVNVPDDWRNYTAIIYMSTDTGSPRWLPKRVNGAFYYYDANGRLAQLADAATPATTVGGLPNEVKDTTHAWGAPTQDGSLVEGTNMMVIPNLSGDFKLEWWSKPAASGNNVDVTQTQGRVAAFQLIENAPDNLPNLDAVRVYQAELTDEANWADLQWTINGQAVDTDPGAADLVELTLTNDATLTFDAATTVSSITVYGQGHALRVVGAANATAAWTFRNDAILALGEGDVLPETIAVYPKRVRYDYAYAQDYTITNAYETEFAAGFSGNLGQINVGFVEFSGDDVAITRMTSGSGTATGTLVFSGDVRLTMTDAGNAAGLRIGNTDVIFRDNAAATLSRIHMRGESATHSSITVEDNAAITVTGSTNGVSNYNTLQFGDWGGTSALTLRDNARFVASAADLMLGGSGATADNSATVTLEDDAEMRVAGVARYNQSSGAIVLNGGSLLVGSRGFRTYSPTTSSVLSVAFNGGVLGAWQNWKWDGTTAGIVTTVTGDPILETVRGATLTVAVGSNLFSTALEATVRGEGTVTSALTTLPSLTIEGGTFETTVAAQAPSVSLEGGTLALSDVLTVVDGFESHGAGAVRIPVSPSGADGWLAMAEGGLVPNVANVVFTLALDLAGAESLLPYRVPLFMGAFRNNATAACGFAYSGNVNNAVSTATPVYVKGNQGQGLYAQLAGNAVVQPHTQTLNDTPYTLDQSTASVYDYWIFNAETAGGKLTITDGGIGIKDVSFEGLSAVITASGTEPHTLLQTETLGLGIPVTFDLAAWDTALDAWAAGAVNGVPASLCLASGQVSVETTPTFIGWEAPAGVIVSIEQGERGLYLVATSNRLASTVSVNFSDRANPLSATPAAPGAYAVPVAAWNDLQGLFSSAQLYVSDIGGAATVQAIRGAGEAAQPTQVSSSATATASATANPSLLQVWLSDSTATTLRVANAPFARYRLALIFSCDIEDAAFATVTVGTDTYAMDAAGYVRKNVTGLGKVAGDTQWGSTNLDTADYFRQGTNVLLTDVITDASVTVSLPAFVYGRTYAGIAAVQIIEAPDTATSEEGTDYTYAFTAGDENVNLANLDLTVDGVAGQTWQSGANNTLSLTVPQGLDVTLTLPLNFQAARISASGDGALTLQVEENGGAALGTLDATGLGNLTVHFPCVGVAFEPADGVSRFEAAFNNNGETYTIAEGATLALGENSGIAVSLDRGASTDRTGASATINVDTGTSVGTLRRDYVVPSIPNQPSGTESDMTMAFKAGTAQGDPVNIRANLLVEDGDVLRVPNKYHFSGASLIYTQTGGLATFESTNATEGGFLLLANASPDNATAEVFLGGRNGARLETPVVWSWRSNARVTLDVSGDATLALGNMGLRASNATARLNATFSENGTLELSETSLGTGGNGTVSTTFNGGRIASVQNEASLTLPVTFAGTDAPTTIDPGKYGTLVLNAANTAESTAAIAVPRGTLAIANANGLGNATATIADGAAFEARGFTGDYAGSGEIAPVPVVAIKIDFPAGVGETGSGGGYDGTAIQEFCLYEGGTWIRWPEGTTISGTGDRGTATWTPQGNGQINALIDRVVGTATAPGTGINPNGENVTYDEATSNNKWFMTDGATAANTATILLGGGGAVFDSYSFFNSDRATRFPSGWTISVRYEGDAADSWTVLDTQANQERPAANVESQHYAVTLRTTGGATTLDEMTGKVVFASGAQCRAVRKVGVTSLPYVARIAGTIDLPDSGKDGIRFFLDGEEFAVANVTVNEGNGTVTFGAGGPITVTDVIWDVTKPTGTWADGSTGPWVDGATFRNGAGVSFPAPTGDTKIAVSVLGAPRPGAAFSVGGEEDYTFSETEPGDRIDLGGVAAVTNVVGEITVRAIDLGAATYDVPINTGTADRGISANGSTIRLAGALSADGKTATLVGSGNLNAVGASTHGAWFDGTETPVYLTLSPHAGECQQLSAYAAHLRGEGQVVIAGQVADDGSVSGGTVEFGGTSSTGGNNAFTGAFVVRDGATLDFTMTHADSGNNPFFRASDGTPLYKNGLVGFTLRNGGTLRFSGHRGFIGGWGQINNSTPDLWTSQPIVIGYRSALECVYGSGTDWQHTPYGLRFDGDGATLLIDDGSASGLGVDFVRGATLTVAGVGDAGDPDDPKTTDGELTQGITATIQTVEGATMRIFGDGGQDDALFLDVHEGSTLRVAADLGSTTPDGTNRTDPAPFVKRGPGRMTLEWPEITNLVEVKVEEGTLGGTAALTDVASVITMTAGTTIEAGLTVSTLTVEPGVTLAIDPTGARQLRADTALFANGGAYLVDVLAGTDLPDDATGREPIKVVSWANAPDAVNAAFQPSAALTAAGYGLEVRTDGLYLMPAITYYRELTGIAASTGSTYQLRWDAKEWYTSLDVVGQADQAVTFNPSEGVTVNVVLLLPEGGAGDQLPGILINLSGPTTFSSLRVASRGTDNATLTTVDSDIAYAYDLRNETPPAEGEVKVYEWLTSLVYLTNGAPEVARLQATVPEDTAYTVDGTSVILYRVADGRAAINVSFAAGTEGSPSWLSAEIAPCGPVPYAGVYWNNITATTGTPLTITGAKHEVYQTSITVSGLVDDANNPETASLTYAYSTSNGFGSVNNRTLNGNARLASAFLRGANVALTPVGGLEAPGHNAGWTVRVSDIPFTHYDLYLLFAGSADGSVTYPAVRVKVGSEAWRTYTFVNGWTAPAGSAVTWTGQGYSEQGFVDGLNLLHLRIEGSDGGSIQIAPCDNSDAAVGLAGLQIVELDQDDPVYYRLIGSRWGDGSAWSRNGEANGAWSDASLKAPHYARFSNTATALEVDREVAVPFLRFDGVSNLTVTGEPGFLSTGGLDFTDVTSEGTVTFEEDVFAQPPQVVLGSGLILEVPEPEAGILDNDWRWRYSDDAAHGATLRKTKAGGLRLTQPIDNDLQINNGTLWLTSVSSNASTNYPYAVTGTGALGWAGTGTLRIAFNNLPTGDNDSENAFLRVSSGTVTLASVANSSLPSDRAVVVEDGATLQFYKPENTGTYQDRPFPNGTFLARDGGIVHYNGINASNLFPRNEITQLPSIRLESGLFQQTLEHAGTNGSEHYIVEFVSSGDSRHYLASAGSNPWDHKALCMRSGRIRVEAGTLGIHSSLGNGTGSKNSVVLLPNADLAAEYGDSDSTHGYLDVATGAVLLSHYPIYAGNGGSNNTLAKVGGGVWVQTQNVCQTVGYNGGGNANTGGTDPYCNIEIREGTFRLNMGDDVLEVPPDTTVPRTITLQGGTRMDGTGTVSDDFDVTIASGATLLSGFPADVTWVPATSQWNGNYPKHFKSAAGRSDTNIPEGGSAVGLLFQGDLTFQSGAILEVNLGADNPLTTTSAGEEATAPTVRFEGTLTVRLVNMPMSITEPVRLTNFAVTPSGLTADGSIICPEAIAIDAEVKLCTEAEAYTEANLTVPEDADTAVKNLWLIPTGASRRWTDATGSWSEEKWHQGDATVRIPNGNNTDSSSSMPNPSNPKDSPTARVESAAGVNLTIDAPPAPTQPNPDAADALNFWGVYGLILTGDTGGDITLAQGGTIALSGATATGNLYGIDVGTSFWKLGDGNATIDALLRLYGNDSTFTVSGGNLTLHRPILQADDVGLPSDVQLRNAFEIGSGATLTLEFALPEDETERNALRAYYHDRGFSAPSEMGSVYPEQAQLLQGPLTGSGTLRVQGEGTSVRLGSINEVGTTADSGVNFSVGTGTTLTLAGALSGGGAAERTATVEAGAIFDLQRETALGSADWTFNLAAGTADETTGTPAGAIVRTDNNVRLRGTVNVTGTGSATLGSGDLAIDDSLTVDVPAGATLTLAAANVMTPSGASDDAVFTKTGAGVLDVTSGNFELGLPVSIEEGTLRLSVRPKPSPSGDRTIDWNVREGGTLAFAGTAGVFNLERYGSLTVEAGGTLALTGGSVTINGISTDLPLLAAGSIVSFGNGTSLPTASSSGVLSFANGGTVDGTVTVALNIDATNPNNLPSQAVTLISFGDGNRQGTGEFILGGDNAAEIAAAGYTLHDNGSTVTLEPFGGDALYTWAANGTEGSEWATGNNWVGRNGTGRVTWPAEFDTPPAVILPEVSPLRDEPTFHIPAAFRTINWTGEAQTLSGLQASNDAANADDGTTGGDYTLTGSAALTVDGTLLKTGTGGLTFNRPVTVGSTGALSLFGGTVTFAKGATLTNTAIDLNNATLAFTGDTGTTISGRLAGNGSGTVLKSGANTLTVRSTIGEAVDRFDIDGGTLCLTADYQADALTPTFDMASGTTLTLGGAVVGGAVIEPTFAEGNTGFTLRWEGAAGTATAASPVLGKVPASTFDYQPASGHLILDPESLPEGAALILGNAVNESSALRLGVGEGGEAIRLSALTAPVGTVIGVEPATDLAAGDWATERALTLALNTEDLVTVGATFMGAVLEDNTTVRAGLTVEKAAGATVEPTLAYIGESDHNALGTLTAGANARVEVTGIWAGPARAAVGGTLAGSGTIGADGTTADNVEVVAGGILSATVTSSATGAIEPAELTVQGDLAIQNGAILAVTAAVQGDGTTAVSHVTTDSVNFTGSRVNIEVRLDAPDEAAVNGKPILTWSSLNGTTEVTAVVKVRNENGDWVDSKDYSVMKEGSRLVLRRASGRFWMILR